MNTTKTNNTQPTTKDFLQDLMQNRNDCIIKGFTHNLESINTELITTIAQIATYKTLKFLQANNATTGTETEQTDNGQKNSYGFDLSIKFLATLTRDIKTLETQNTDETITDAFDLVQIASETISPYFQSTAIFSLSDTVYTKTLKNGNEKSYTIFSLACKGIRDYITAQQQRQYKKLSYIVGYTDNGNVILTTKKPKNDITDTTETDRNNLLNKYNLTAQEQTALLYLFDGLNTTQTAEQMQVSKRTIERALKSAKEKIQSIDKRIRL